ncbi:sensor histidine kinase [Lachnoclostridium phytofermentans]|jgi:two-component system sensor histidine kinase AgrC|uniref:sensor histidine kinase n=1 Tax=Lachnoclostridium phytofermentans TaxID=66219 RepID=UPI0004954E8C|nr:ATP-binding protein [Lachnoclostridium phytofermentans]
MDTFVIINFGCVLLFGITLSLSFGGISFQQNIRQYLGTFCAFGLTQLIAFYSLGSEFLFKSYPLLTHIPLFFLLKCYFKKSSYIAGIAVLSAYLFCTPRKWIGTLVSSFWSYDMRISYLVQILITIPLLIVIVRYISPYVARLKFESNKILRLFIIVPLIYYGIEYFITVYTDLLYNGGAATVEFMDASIVTVYFIFSIIYLKTLYEKKEIEVEYAVLTIMTKNFDKEIAQLKTSQTQLAICRHDLRHHLNYLNACISENKLQEAASYIEQTCEDINNTKVVQYSQNEPLNLILSSYVNKALEKEITIEVLVSATNFIRFQITDLCSLLANAIENAIHGCEQLTDSNCRYIKLHMYEKSNKLCLNIHNSYAVLPTFVQGLPVSSKEGHGIGVKSMIYVVEKYHGVYGFHAKDGRFTFQMSM